MHRVRGDLDQGGRGRGAGVNVRRRIGWKHDLGHEDVPGLLAVAAGVDLLVGAVPDSVRPARAARLDPWKDVGGVAGRRRAIAYLDGPAPHGPTSGRARRADEDLAVGGGAGY